MQIYDIIMILVLVAASIFGAYKGLAWQIASLSSIFLSFVVACRFREPVSEYIDADPPWNTFAAMLILYIATSLAIWIAFRFVSGFIDRLKMKEFDRQLGALFGLAKGVVLSVIITLFAVTLLGEDQRQTIFKSRSGYYIAVLLNESHAIMPEEVHDVLHPYVHSLDRPFGLTSHHDDSEIFPANLLPNADAQE
jgi:membrane protein required for colicin V production